MPQGTQLGSRTLRSSLRQAVLGPTLLALGIAVLGPPSLLAQGAPTAQDEPRWVGEPVTLSLKDADLAETLRSFAQLGNFNLILDPNVSGSVTVELKNVPWDQALDAILKTHGLGMEVTGGRLVIASREAITDYRRRLETVQTVELRPKHLDPTLLARALDDPTVGALGPSGLAQARSDGMLVLRATGGRLLRVSELLTELDRPEHTSLSQERLIERCRTLWRAHH